jgi:Xaa-Pro aminopeptidase
MAAPSSDLIETIREDGHMSRMLVSDSTTCGHLLPGSQAAASSVPDTSVRQQGCNRNVIQRGLEVTSVGSVDGFIQQAERETVTNAPAPDQFCNLERLLEMMARLDLDGVVSSYSLNVFYLSGFYGTQAAHEANSSGVVIIPRERPERAILLVADLMLATFATRPTWIEDVRPYPGALGLPFDPERVHRMVPAPLKASPIGAHMLANYTETKDRALIKALRDLGIDKGRIGFDNLQTPTALADLDLEVVNAYRPLIWVRMVKVPNELDRLAHAAQINQQAIEGAVASWDEGMTLHELNRTYDRIARDLGGIVETPVSNAIFNADADDPLAAEPLPFPWQTGVEADYVLRPGANIMFDCHGFWKKYCWDGGKTWIIGDEVKGETKRIADASGVATEEMVSMMKPGVRISELQKLGRDVFEKHGLRANDVLVFFHGLGLEHNDLETAPGSEREVQDQFDWMLKNGMIAACHIAYPGDLRERYFIEDIAIVTDHGGSSLFDWGVKPLVNAR